MRRCGTLVAVFVVLLPVVVCFAQPTPHKPPRLSTHGFTKPITVERLTGSSLRCIRRDPKLVWSFGKKEFVLKIGGKIVPRELIKTLTGRPDNVVRIEGTWTLDAKKKILLLMVIQADGKPVHHRALLPIQAAGPIRANLGAYQYNFFLSKVKLEKPRPVAAYKQDGKDLMVTMTIEVPDAPHIAWTHAKLIRNHDPRLEGPSRSPQLSWVELSYYVIQSRDDPGLVHMRHRKKKIELTWRLTDHRKSTVPYHVINQFNPSAAELEELAPQLQRLAEETQNRAPLSVP